MHYFSSVTSVVKIFLRNMSQKLVYPATERNRQPILDILKLYLPSDRASNVLEISSGSGQHISFFAEHFPNITFQPSEYDLSLFKSIQAYIKDYQNVHQPLHIDITTDFNSWNIKEKFEFILNVNMMHISPFKCTQGLFNNSQHVLKSNGMLITYGPYANNGVIEPESNIRFNQSLRQSDPEWGLRDIQVLKQLAMECGLELVQIHNMPSNNKMLIWKKIKNMDSKSLIRNKYELHYFSYNGKTDQVTKLAFIEKYMNEQDDDGRTPLLLACAQNHTSVAKYLINLGANINCQDNNLSTPLHWAAYNSNVELVNILIEREANVQAKDLNGIQAIHLAALKGNNEIIRILISREITEEITDRLGITPLHLASYCGHNEVVEVLLGTGCFGINVTDNNSINSLNLAASSCHTHTVKLLKDKRAFTSTDDLGRSPLHWAGVCGNVELINILSPENDWQGDSLDKFKSTPMFLATSYGHDEAVNILLQKNCNLNLESGEREIYLILTNLEGPDGVINKYYNEIGTLPNTLHWAAAFCSNNIVEKLLNNGANIEELGISHNTPLHTAASFGNKDVIELLINRGANINALDEDENTPLHWAIAHCHVEIVHLLLNKGADKNNALCWAAASGHLSLVKLLIDSGCDINEEDGDSEYSRTPLMWAATCGYAEIIKFLLDNGADISNYDVIHWCTVHGLIDSIKMLIERGVDVNESDLCFNRTALHWAAISGNIEVTRYLLSVEGIEVNAVEDQGDLPIHYAVNGNHYEIIKMLIDHGAKVNKRGDLGRPLCMSARDGDLRTVEILVEGGADINRPEFDDDTPMNLALIGGNMNIVNYLLEKGAEKIQFIHQIAEYGSVSDLIRFMKPEDVNSVDDMHRTPIFRTVHGNVDNLKFLIEKGANVNHKDSLNRTPLYLAVQYNNINSVITLIDNGAEVNVKTDLKGGTPVLMAIENGNMEILKLLINNNASIEVTDDNHWGPLHYAAQNSDEVGVEIVQYLISKKVNVKASDPQGITPLYLAVVSASDRSDDNFSIIKLLLDNGAEINTRISEGFTPLSRAVQDKNYKLVKLLILYGADIHLDKNIFKYCTDAEDIVILELLRFAGLRLNNVEIPLNNEPEITHFIFRAEHRPLSLRQLCRIAIRHACGKQYLKIVNCGYLPNVVKQYLLFEMSDS